MYRLILNDYSAKEEIGVFETIEEAQEIVAIIDTIPRETHPQLPDVSIRCFAVGDRRYIEQGGQFIIEKICILSKPIIKKLTVKEFFDLEREANGTNPVMRDDVNLDKATEDLC